MYANFAGLVKGTSMAARQSPVALRVRSNRGLCQYTLMPVVMCKPQRRPVDKRYGVAFSQPRAVAVSDIDGDGLTDIVVGKRRWAHGNAIDGGVISG